MRLALLPLLLVMASSWTSPAMAQAVVRPGVIVAATPDDAATPQTLFQASSSQPFSALMEDAMRRMMDGMHAEPASGDPGRDFVTMMVPHHQGAIDMARALLAHSDDPELRNLAQSILVEQGSEIALMRAWLVRHDQSTQTTVATPSHAMPAKDVP